MSGRPARGEKHMAKSLKVTIAAGGTAGHINPALALAEELRDRGHSVSFVGQTAKLEGRLVPEAGFPLIPIHVQGFDRSRPWTAVKSLAMVSKAKGALGRAFAEQGAPDVCLGFGAYVEVPLLSWCRKNGVPYLLHEQNSVPGLANRMCAANAARVCCALPQALGAFEGKGASGSSVVTGNPVRRSVIKASREAGRTAFGVPEGATMLLVFGGSLGAHHLNEAVCGLKDELLGRPDLYVVHSTGADDEGFVRETLALTEDEAARWQVMPYISNMGEALAAADLVVSRAGASSIAEIAALAAPSILVPYPHATADHQTTNAHYLVDAGAAILVADAQLGDAPFSSALTGLLDAPERREAMREAARGLGSAKAAAALADQVESVARA